MLCDICGRDGARIRRVTETHGKGKDLLVIEQVPMVSCPSCGESYFTADTLFAGQKVQETGFSAPGA